MRPLRIAILGGGMAGSSLAYRLCDQRFAQCRVDIYEPRATSARDRTWCYFALHAHPFVAAVSQRWWHCNVARGAQK